MENRYKLGMTRIRAAIKTNTGRSGVRLPRSEAATMSIFASCTREDPMCLSDSTVKTKNNIAEKEVRKLAGRKSSEVNIKIRAARLDKAKIRRGESEEERRQLTKTNMHLRIRNMNATSPNRPTVVKVCR